VATNGGSASGTRILTAGGTTGLVTITPTVSSATNTTLGGNAILDTTTTTTVDVVANRVVTATAVAFGRVLVGQAVSATSTLSTTGDDADFTRITVGTTGPDGNGISATGGANAVFNSASVTDTRTVGGIFSTAGSLTGNLTLPTTGEGLVGETPIDVALNYTVDPVNKRMITNGATTNLGTVHSGTTINGTSNVFTTTGTHDTTTDVTVAAGSGVADGNGVDLTGALTTFDGTISSDTRTFGGTITSATGGSVSGNFNLAVTTLENGGVGLAGEGSYNPVNVGYTAFVYTGQGVWNASGSGTWGTISAPTNWTADGGAPGLDPNFTSTDSATFGNSIGAATATVTLAGDTPSLNTITFSNTLGGSYIVAQGSGGTLVLNDGSGTALINNLGGNNTISAPVQIESNTSATAAGGSVLTLAGAISEQGGSFGLTVNGPGTVVLGDNNTYSGGTTLSFGTLDVSGSGTLGSSTGALTVDGGTLNLGGTSQTVGAVNITGASTIQTGILTGSSYSDSAPSGTATVSATLAGSGALTMSGGGTLALNGANTYSGGTIISSGTLATGNLTALGTGDVSMSGGILEAGNGIHQINVAGNYTQTGGTLVLNLSGTTAGASPGYDFLNVAGTASLGGALQIVVLSPYVPRNGDTFDFVQAGTITGDFSSITSNLASLSVTGQGVGGVTITQLPFATLPGITYTTNQLAVAAYIDTSFQNGASSPAFQTLLGALNNLTATGASPAALPGAFDQLTPEKFSNFARTTIFNNASFSTQLFDSYLENQRCWEGDFLRCRDEIDSSGLTVIDPSVDPGLAQVSSQLLAWNPAPLPHGLLSDTSNSVMGGVDMAMPMPMNAPEKERAFNIFVMGNVILAQDFSQADVPHSDTTTGAVQIGVDYLITPHLKVGALMGFGHTDATLDNIGSKATIDTYTPGVYAAFADKGWYVNALGSYGFNSLTEDRSVSFGGLNGIAHGAPTGDQIIGDLDGGYDFHVNKLTFGPAAGVQYTHYDIDGFTEDGSDPINLQVNREESDSLRSRLGGHVSYAFKAGKVTLKPHLDAFWQHEFLDQSQGITSQFTSVGAGSFTTRASNPSRDSALIDGGLNADLNGQVSVYLDYVVQAGQSNYFGQSVQAGVRVAF
jgi:autotransporter-associated beta strand protein